MVFLSYPKYYRDTEEKLMPVDTNLVESTDPDWDYEVSKGIWQLKVKADGTFQAQHEGDVFTYRFQSLGYGLGDSFQPIDLGEPNFSNFSVERNAVVWADVFPDVNLRVIYANDTLKVDVIIKQAFRNDLQDVYQAGDINEDEFLTAKFDIPSVFVGSEARQGEEPVDLYSQNLDLNMNPIHFVRNEKVVHKLRLVETYVIDEDGQPIYADENGEPINIQSKQNWQLSRGEPGIAEISTRIGDIINAPQGNIMIDPSLSFGYNTGATQDAELDYNNSSNLGGNSVMNLEYNSSSGVYDRAVFGCDFNDPSYNPLGTDKAVTDIKLKIRIRNNTLSGYPVMRIYNITEEWSETSVDWYEQASGNSWTSPGGTYDEHYKGPAISYVGGYYDAQFDLLAPFLQRYPNMSEYLSKGFLFKLEGGSGGRIEFLSKEYVDPLDGSTDERWSFEVTYTTNARTQEKWFRPFLIDRTGDPYDKNNRFFPIAYYLGIDHIEQLPHSWDDGSVVELADGVEDSEGNNHFDTYIYNSFFTSTFVENRDKLVNFPCSAGYPEQISEIDDYLYFTDTLQSIYDDPQFTTKRDYYMLPGLIGFLYNPTVATGKSYDSFIANSNALAHGIGESDCVSYTYYPTEQASYTQSLANAIEDERIKGWGFNEEFIARSSSSDRNYQSNRLLDYRDWILAADSTNHHPFYAIEPWTIFYNPSSNSFNSNLAQYLDYFDYILEDGSYYHDFKSGFNSLDPEEWEDAVYMVETVMENMDIGYCRFISLRDFYGFDYATYAKLEQELYRYLPYASWVVGGQGVIGWSYNDGDAEKWFPLAHQIAQEAYAMKDYLMNPPALDIPAYIQDSANNDNVRFILKRNQQNPSSNTYLLLFCNFANDGSTHTTKIHFPNHTISNVNPVAGRSWSYQLQDSNHTLYFTPNSYNDSKKDVYARAFFVTLN